MRTGKSPGTHYRRHRQQQSPFNLTKLYNDFNKQFFGGKLPRYRVTFSKEVYGPWKGICLNERRLIRLRRGIEPEEIRRTLLHEMCHIGSLGHGKRFQEKLLRLAEQGEVWAKEEMDQYRETLAAARRGDSVDREVRDQLDTLAHELSPRPSFARLVRKLAAYHGFRPSEFKKQFPWLNAAWKKACREADVMMFEDEAIRRVLERKGR